MIVVAENIDRGGKMELAMLLDDSPAPPAPSGEPWKPGGNLAKASSSAISAGRAELYIVFQSDPPRTWGDKVVIAFAGGLLYTADSLVPLRYEVVARNVFQNCAGKDTTLPYRILVRAELSPDPEISARNGKASRDDLLGMDEPQTEQKIFNSSLGEPDMLGSGVTVTWMDQTGYQEVWFVGDAAGLLEYKFDLTEYSRRTYVQCILNILGFVGKKEFSASRERSMLQALLRGALPQLTALQQLCLKNSRELSHSDIKIGPPAAANGQVEYENSLQQNRLRRNETPLKRPAPQTGSEPRSSPASRGRTENVEVIDLD